MTDTVADGGTIDRTSPTPLYHQLEQILRTDIQGGVYAPGDLLPSENEICERYDVSRSVVRQTLQNLARAGFIHTERGRGSFVVESKVSERFVQQAAGFYEDLTRMGLEVTTEVVRQGIAPVPLEVREFLGVDSAVRIDRVRSVDGRRLLYVTTYIPVERCPGLEAHDLTDRSLYAHLEEAYGLRVHSGRRSIEAVPAEEDAAEHLGIPPGAPVLLLRSASRSEDGQPLEWFAAWHRADRTRFEVEIVDGKAAQPVQQTVIAAATPPIPATAETDVRDGFRQHLERERVIAVVRAPSYGDGAAVAGGLLDGGVSIVEFTLTGTNALQAIEQARAGVPDALIGAGSVLTLEDARRAVEAGAQFLVSPARLRELVSVDLGVPVVLAGYTPSEVLEAYRLTRGSPVKVFPASAGGPGYLRALAAPMPKVPLMPSGGVDETNLAEFLAAGAFALNLGSSLCPVPAVVEGDAAQLRRRATTVRARVDEALG
ncbi:UTRA domain-containing protein [Egicoccus sp. AB-alg2]|uniref:UTRA domain-containing protein n=1 Tax=Egicoccus sp. AB-alg2 TaxID=3242693 RepID=UPI00359E8814